MKAFNPERLTERRDVFVLDGVRFALEMERTAFSRLVRSMRAIERSPAGQPPSDGAALRALESAWSVCDSAFRARGLISQVRGLKQSTPPMQLFLRATEPVIEVRNYLQHLDTEIGKLGESTVPLIGQLRWRYATGEGGVGLSVGHWTKGTHGLTPVIDLRTMKVVAGIWFSVADSSLDLEDLHQRCRAISKHLEKWLVESDFVTATSAAPSTLRFGTHLRAGV